MVEATKKTITELREEKEWSIRGLAQRSQISHETLRKIEFGTKGTMKTIGRIAVALGIPRSELEDYIA